MVEIDAVVASDKAVFGYYDILLVTTGSNAIGVALDIEIFKPEMITAYPYGFNDGFPVAPRLPDDIIPRLSRNREL